MYRRVRRLKARKGFAMFMALGALVIIGVASHQEKPETERT